MKLNKNQIQSRRNGLILSVPNTNITGNLMQRFSIKGENELVFDQATVPTHSVMVDNTPMTGDATADAAGGESLDNMI